MVEKWKVTQEKGAGGVAFARHQRPMENLAADLFRAFWQ